MLLVRRVGGWLEDEVGGCQGEGRSSDCTEAQGKVELGSHTLGLCSRQLEDAHPHTPTPQRAPICA